MLSPKELLELATSAETVDYATAKRSLPIAFILEQHNFSVTADGPRQLSLCPFHEDRNTPSLNIYGDGLEHWACWTCSAKGDALDILKRLEPELCPDGRDSAALFRRAHELIVQAANDEWTGPAGLQQRKPYDPKAASELVEQSLIDIDYDKITEFIDWKRNQRSTSAWPYSATWLSDRWGVGTYGGKYAWIIVPYYDSDNTLFAYKRWISPDKPRLAASGSDFRGHLYGEWRDDDGRKPIILCEGESDTWYADYHLGQSFRVLGLPTGVNTSTECSSGMANRTVYLAFDADGDAESKGRMATRKWAEALEAVGASVKIVPIPDGRDLSTSGVDIDQLIEQSAPLVHAPAGLEVTPAGYAKYDKKGNLNSVSNWVFAPTRVLHGDGTSAYEGVIKPGGDTAVLSSFDLRSDNAVLQWATKFGRSWYGSSIDARRLLGMLQAESVFLPSGRLVTVAGLHNGTFVWPGGRIGDNPLTYVPPQNDARLDTKLKIRPGNWDTSIVHLMRDIQSHKVTDPMLAWLAIAPLRTLSEQFPFVAVSGNFGDGKTQTSQALLHAFSGSYIESTFRSTPNSMSNATSATNAFPIDLEEYRKGGRKDTLEVGEQIFREAYTMQVRQTGGLGTNWAASNDIIPAAPLLMTGEDLLTEGSHSERLIPITIDRLYQNPKAYDALREIGTNGFPHAWLSFLQYRIKTGMIKKPLPIKTAGPADLAGRQRYNLGILYYGWHLLQEFMSENNDNLSDPDFSKVVSDLQSNNKQTPIETAVLWCMAEPDARSFVQIVKAEGKETEIWIQPESFYIFISHPSRSQLFKMAGNVQAVEHYLLTRLGGREEIRSMRKFIAIPYAKVRTS